jgi:adenylate kinase family enzyme
MPGHIILLTGPPGAGKTTVAPLLCANAPGPTAIHLETDFFYRSIKKGWLAPWTLESHGQNQVVAAAMLSVAITYAQGGYEVVTDGIITDWVKQIFVDGARAAGVTLDFIVLIPDQAIAAKRGRTRTADPIPDYSPYEALYGLFAAEDAAHAVDTGTVAPKDLAAVLREGIEAGRFKLAG